MCLGFGIFPAHNNNRIKMRPIRQIKDLICSWSFVAGCMLGLVILLMTNNDGTPAVGNVRNQAEIEALLAEKAQARVGSIKSGIEKALKEPTKEVDPAQETKQKVPESRLPSEVKGGHKAKGKVKPPKKETKPHISEEEESPKIEEEEKASILEKEKQPKEKNDGQQATHKRATKPKKVNAENQNTAEDQHNAADTKQKQYGEEDPSFQSNIENYQKALQHYAENDLIFISSVDSAYLQLGLNLYYSSFKKFSIQNYIFVASDANVCPVLVAEKINCVEFIHVGSSDKAEPFYTVEFMLKSFVKTKLVLEALKLDLQVLLVDVDMVFYKNPLDHFPCGACDIQAMAENDKNHVINTGFYLARPTQSSVDLHERALERMSADAKTKKLEGSDQKYVNNVLAQMRADGGINSELLDTRKFPNAMEFFEYGRRVFRGDGANNDEVVVMHNNFVVTLEAKIYRFKEYGLWNLDYGGYYSNKTTKYLTYDNPITITDDTDLATVITRETEALKTALKLGVLLKRVVILPAFHNYRSVCRSPRNCTVQWETCSLQGIYFIQHFDQYFYGKYREHSFLGHPLVPKSVKRSKSPIYVFESPYTHNELSKLPKEVTLLEPRDVLGINKQDLKENFARLTEKYSVLRFHSLYINVTNYNIFGNKFPKALTRTGYMQNPKGTRYLQRKNLKV